MSGAPVQQGPFRVPSFKSFVPRKIQPWIYLAIAFIFQMSGGIYGGVMHHVMGEFSLMREDVMMVVMCNVVGVAMPFPYLFKMKFRYTNRRLLLNAALVVSLCNILITFTESLPLLCVLAWFSGFFKCCGTFECMSTIQLWMTPKRDFTIFFPLLYIIILGNMCLSPFIAEHLAYTFGDWRMMNYAVAGALLLVTVMLYTCTVDFHFMKPMPFISIDYLGCVLWSALMLEFIFFFNYGEHYQWLNSIVMRKVVVIFFITLYFCLKRMRHIRHPYIDPKAWKFKKVPVMLILFAFTEIMDSTPKTLQNTLTGSILHWGSVTTDVLNLVEWGGVVLGCLFSLFWYRVLKFKYTRLLTLGVVAMAAYPVIMYFIVDPGLPIKALYLPTVCRAFGHAVFFCTLTIYLEEAMPFPYFFMGLTMAGLLRNGPVSTMCTGVYSFALRHQMADNLARGLQIGSDGLMLLSIKQLYGLTCLLGIAVLLIFLLWDLQPVRSTMKKIPSWNFIGRRLRREREFRV